MGSGATGLAASLRRGLRASAFAGWVLVGVAVAGALAVRFRLERRHPRARPLAAWWKRGFARVLGLRVHVEGEPAARPVFLVANHISWLDIVAVGSRLPVAFVSKAEVRNWPLVGWMVRHGGTLFLERGANQATQISDVIGRRLEEGGAVMVFAEGTTSAGGSVRPFFPRLFAPVAGTGRCIQPVAIRYRAEGPVHPTAPFIDDDPMPAHLWRVLGEKRIDVELHFLEPLSAAEGEDRKALAGRTRSEICRALGLPEELARPAADGDLSALGTSRRRAFARAGERAPAAKAGRSEDAEPDERLG